MAISLVAGSPAVAGNTALATTIAVTAAAAVATGNILIVAAGASGVPIAGVSDSLGNTYASQVVDGGHTGVGTMEVWTVKSAFTGTPTVTVSYNVATQFRFAHVSGWTTDSSFTNATADQTADSQTAGTAATAITTPDVTPAHDGELIFCAFAENTGTPTVNSPYTLLTQDASGSSSACGYQIQGSAAAVHGSANCTGATNWTVVLATFFDNAASPSTTPGLILLPNYSH